MLTGVIYDSITYSFALTRAAFEALALGNGVDAALVDLWLQIQAASASLTTPSGFLWSPDEWGELIDT